MNKTKLRKMQNGRSLLDIALDVHMTNTGSCERSKEEQTQDKIILHTALDTWESSNKKWEKFDNCVQELLITALHEESWYEQNEAIIS